MASITDDRDLADLLAATAARDRAAFGELYRRTAPKLYAIVLRIMREGSRAEDVMQDVYVRIWNGAATFDAGRGRPITWLATVARNLAIDHHRRDGAKGSRHGSDDELAGLASGHDGSASSEDLAALRVCLGRLDAEQRRLVLAAYLDGATREELAERAGRPTGTIKSWLHRALAQLKACLGG